MLSFAAFLLIALIVGTIAKALVPGRDPGVGLAILLGGLAQIAARLIGRAFGRDYLGQPWLFFLSIGAAAVLLYIYREMGMDEIPARRHSEVPTAPQVRSIRRSPRTESIWVRLALAPVWAALGALQLGVTGFLIGFYGPMHYQPWSNQGPMLGIFVTGPAGVILGALIGAALKIVRPDWPTRWRVWFLNAATAAYGLGVLHIVVDSSWWPGAT